MLIRFLNFLLNKIGIRTIVAGILIVTLFGSVAFGLSGIVYGTDLSFFLRIGILALIVNWLLAKSEIRSWIAALLIMTIGILNTVITVGDLFRPLYSYIRVAFSLLWDILNYTPDVGIDKAAYNLAFAEIYFSISHMVESIIVWIKSLSSSLLIFDKSVMALIWGMIFWMMTSWLVWLFRRNRNPMLGILPVGIVISAAFAYTRSDAIPLAPFLFSSLLLFAFVNFDQSESNWLDKNIDFPEDLQQDFSFLTTAIVIFLVLTASFLPTFSIRDLINRTQEYTQPVINDLDPIIQSFGLDQENSEYDDFNGEFSGGLPRRHLIGSGPELSQDLVMFVSVKGDENVKDGRNNGFPAYWRSIIFDQYSGSGWNSSEIVFRDYKAGDIVDSISSVFHHVLTQDFRFVKEESKYLYAAGEILKVDRDLVIANRSISGAGESTESYGDFFGALVNQSIYRVESMVPVINDDDLKSAPGEIPAWIRKRYTALPDTIPERVFDLAEEVTRDGLTTYDKVLLLEQFLRGYKYSLDVEELEGSSDLVDSFLFDQKEGYCDHFASSMVVMARSLGIPTRLVIGYSQGLFDEINNRFIVTEADAHTWVEVYFQEIGWIPFEPTGGRDFISPPNLDDEAVLKLLDPSFMEVIGSWFFSRVDELGYLYFSFTILILFFLLFHPWLPCWKYPDFFIYSK